MGKLYYFDLLWICCRTSRTKALSELSQKSATVAENGETTAKFGDCRTFLRQCGHVAALADHLLITSRDETQARSTSLCVDALVLFTSPTTLRVLPVTCNNVPILQHGGFYGQIC